VLLFAKLILVVVVISSALFFLMLLLATRKRVRRNSLTPYECGFDPVHSARTPFSLRFFLLAIIFLIFDVEVAVLFPIIFVLAGDRMVAGVGRLLFFLSFLLVGLFHEWREGSLEWV